MAENRHDADTRKAAGLRLSPAAEIGNSVVLSPNTVSAPCPSLDTHTSLTPMHALVVAKAGGTVGATNVPETETRPVDAGIAGLGHAFSPVKQTYRFYNVSGYVEVSAESVEAAKAWAYDTVKGVHRLVIATDGPAFVCVAALGEPEVVR